MKCNIKILEKTGVYIIKNKINNKIYVGSASSTRKYYEGFKRRFYKHKYELKNNKHRNSYLQNSWNKYGEDNFEFLIIAFCPPEYCIKLEQYFIDSLKPEYNFCPTAGSNKGVKFTEEHKRKISEANKGKIVTWGDKIAFANRKENNPEKCKLLSIAAKNRKISPEGLQANRTKRRLHKSIAKLTDEQAREIKVKLKEGVKCTILAKEYNVNSGTISAIKHNRTFKDILI